MERCVKICTTEVGGGKEAGGNQNFMITIKKNDNKDSPVLQKLEKTISQEMPNFTK